MDYEHLTVGSRLVSYNQGFMSKKVPVPNTNRDSELRRIIAMVGKK